MPALLESPEQGCPTIPGFRIAHGQIGRATRNLRRRISDLGHRDVRTTIYTHVLNRGGRGVQSPADDL